MKAAVIAVLAGMAGCTFAQSVSAADAGTFTEKVLWSFTGGPDGRYPNTGLIDVNGTLFGTASAGGRYGHGVVFSFNPSTGTNEVLFSFCKGGRCRDGADPSGSLIDVNGLLYGTTAEGGRITRCYDYGCGTVFSLDPSSGAEKVLHAFCSQSHCADGASPTGSLIEVKGLLYGTTPYGGNTGCFNGSGCGTIFSLDPNTGVEKVLYVFCSQSNCADGQIPSGNLISVNGKLYGTALGGSGADCPKNYGAGCGTVFSFDRSTGVYTVLYSFCGQADCADGAYPNDGLVDVNGIVYGTTGTGGSTNCTDSCGVVFSIDPDTGAESVIHSFLGGFQADGAWPAAGLIAVKGLLYGTTPYGGNGSNGSGVGTVFTVDPATGVEAELYSFCQEANCADGEIPRAPLTHIGSTLYGTTTGGGAYCQNDEGCGTVFALSKTR